MKQISEYIYLSDNSLSQTIYSLQNCPHAGEGTTTYSFTNTEIVCWIQYDQYDGDDEINLLHLDGSFSFLQREEGCTARPLWGIYRILNGINFMSYYDYK